MKRVVIAGEIYSTNMGDRAIHDCIAHMLTLVDPTIEIIPIDISGRLPVKVTENRMDFKQRMSLLQAVPGFRLPLTLSKVAFHQMKMLQGQSKKWRRILETADKLVIGGGQLLMDDTLNFPLKLSALTRLAQELNLPYHIFACGVGASWSKLGKPLFQKALRSAQSITLRDHLSQERLLRFLPDLACQITSDPAIWAAAVYPIPTSRQTGNCLGLNVINRREANFHFPTNRQFSKSAWTGQWFNLLSKLVQDNQHVELFTTGSPTDYAFALELSDLSHKQGWKQVSLAPYPNTPLALITSMSNYSMVAAARLHASILANACGVSTIGLVWDQKVKAYYADTGRESLSFDLTRLDSNKVVQACTALMGQPFPNSKIKALKMRSLENMRIILNQV